MVQGVTHSKRLLGDLADLTVLVVGLVKSGPSLGSIGKVFDLFQQVKGLIVEAPLALPELADLDAVESSQLAGAAYEAVKRIVDAIKADKAAFDKMVQAIKVA